MRLRCVTSNLCVYVCVHACVAMAIISSGVHPPRIDNRGEGSQNNNITDLCPQSINLLAQSIILLFQNCSTPHHSCSVSHIISIYSTWITEHLADWAGVVGGPAGDNREGLGESTHNDTFFYNEQLILIACEC